MRQQTRPLKEPAEKVVQDISTGDAQALFGRGEDPDRAGRSAWRGQHCRAVSPQRSTFRCPALQHECRLAYVPTTVPSGRPSRGIMIVFRRTLCRLGVASRCCFNRRVSDAAVLAAMLTERARMEGASRQARPHNSEQPCTVPVCVSLPPP